MPLISFTYKSDVIMIIISICAHSPYLVFHYICVINLPQVGQCETAFGGKSLSARPCTSAWVFQNARVDYGNNQFVCEAVNMYHHLKLRQTCQRLLSNTTVVVKLYIMRDKSDNLIA